jgi:uncharacterized membrane protein YeaQ/YmgE (transglycosylase-associated protein family)
MIFGAEIGLLVFGLITLIRGQFNMGKDKKIVGPKARLLGIICLAPLLLSMIVGLLIGFSNPEAVAGGQLKGITTGIEIGILIGALIILTLLSKNFYRRQAMEGRQTP